MTRFSREVTRIRSAGFKDALPNADGQPFRARRPRVGDPRGSYLVHASRGKKAELRHGGKGEGREEKEKVGEKGRPRGVKIMFREHVINRRGGNKARSVLRAREEGGRRDERINHGGFAPLKSLLRPDKNRKRIQGPTRRPRHLGCVLKARLRVVVVVFHRLASLSDAAASFAWSPTSEGFYLETRCEASRERAEEKCRSRRGRDFNDNNDMLLKPRRASQIVNPRGNTALLE